MEEVAAKKKENYGYTAEQIANKLEIDPSAAVILEHLLAQTNEFELERLLLRVIQQRHLALDDEADRDALFALETCFRIAFDLAKINASPARMDQYI